MSVTLDWDKIISTCKPTLQSLTVSDCGSVITLTADGKPFHFLGSNEIIKQWLAAEALGDTFATSVIDKSIIIKFNLGYLGAKGPVYLIPMLGFCHNKREVEEYYHELLLYTQTNPELFSLRHLLSEGWRP